MRRERCWDIAAVILAAGEGKRFGENKALANHEGQSFLGLIGDNLRRAGCGPIIAVLGSQAAAVAREADRIGIAYAINSAWKDGQFSSLKTGLAAFTREVCGAVIALVDHPFVRFETYVKLKEAFAKNPRRIIIPLHDRKRGHPVVIPYKIMREVMESPDETNLKVIIGKHERMVNLVRSDDPGVVTDIDTREDLDRISGR